MRTKIIVILCIFFSFFVPIKAEEDYRPGILKSNPRNNDQHIPIDTQITVEFSHRMIRSTATPSSVALYNEYGQIVKTSFVWDDLSLKLYVKPIEKLVYDTEYSLILTSYLLKDINNKELRENFSMSFRTEKVQVIKGNQKEAPRILSIYPKKDEENIPLDAKIMVGFNKDMKSSTINQYTFNVEDMKGNRIEGIFKYSHKIQKVVFVPQKQFDNNMVYRVRLTQGITDPYGNILLNPETWTFKTLPPADKTPPYITKTSPIDKAFGITLNSDISIEFNENLNASTINTVNFSLIDKNKDIKIPITLSYSKMVNKVIINPEGGLSFDKEYIVKISRGVKDESGNFMLYDYNFEFKTEKEGDITPPKITSTLPIDKSNNFKVDSHIKLFLSEELDNTSINERNIFLFRKNKENIKEKLNTMLLYNNKNKSISIIPEKKLDYECEFIIEITNLKDLAGNSLEQGFTLEFTTEKAPDTTAPQVVSVSPSPKSYDIAIMNEFKIRFSEPVNALTINNKSILLTNENNGHQIFFEFNTGEKLVETVTCRTMTSMEYLTRYHLKIGPEITDKAGNLMEEPYETFFVTEKNPDILPPKLLTIKPEPNERFVSINTTINMEFSEALRKDSINSLSILLSEGNRLIECDISYFEKQNKVLLKPQVILDYNKKYKITLTPNIKDLAGNSFEEKTLYFMTELPPDRIPPYVMITSPVEGSIDVSVDAMITVTFSEDIDEKTLENNFYIKSGIEKIKAHVTYNKLTHKAVLEPEEKLQYSESYTAYITDDIKDLSANAMEKTKVWNFKVETPPDIIPPSILYFEPAADRKDVPVTAKVKIKFSEPMKESTINEYAVMLSSSDKNRIDGIVNYVSDENTLEFYPGKNLDYGTDYFFLLNTAVKDRAGNSIKAPLKFNFRTILAPDNIRPTIVEIYPQDGRENIPHNTDIIIKFSENIESESLNRFTCFLKNITSDEHQDIDIFYDNNTFEAKIKPVQSLEYFCDYSVILSRIIRDIAGNNLKSTFVSKFRVEPAPDAIPPQVFASYPKNDDINIRINESFYLQFTERMYEDSINISNIYLKDQNERKIPVILEYNAEMNRVNIIPEYSLDYEQNYTIIANKVTDIAGNPIRSGFTLTFKTEKLPDMESPRIISYSPKDLERGISVNQKIIIYFSEAMDKEKVNASNILVEKFNDQVETKLFYDIRESRLEIIPVKPLDFTAEYKILISSAMTDLSGNLLDRTYVWKFYTEPPPDRVKPYITDVFPKEDSENNDYTTKISIQFSEKVRNETVNKYTFWLGDDNGNSVDFKIVYNGDQDRAVLMPLKPLHDGKYIVNITEGILDLAGNVLSNPKKYGFTVGLGTQRKIPVVVVTNPESNSINVSPYQDITATFNVPIDNTTLNEYTFVVSDGVSRISGKFAYNDYLYRAVFHPDEILRPDTVYSVTLTSGIKSLDGVNLDKSKVIMFRTADK
ncbi:MAG: Ig-like domain-containing protein [Candidatus Muirbacterium halophilum]|nr:Ig-like domain-containing protein [Candidatus Muirbacterium halophilum]MCK9474995.1 Ig-like domain-containing protein [Candidatus Muirbacterium halophilum]